MAHPLHCLPQLLLVPLEELAPLVSALASPFQGLELLLLHLFSVAWLVCSVLMCRFISSCSISAILVQRFPACEAHFGT